ncbi:ADP-ribosylglycohydrolase family protein [Actinocorallia sp. B10E7]
MTVELSDRVRGCVLGGAVGDALGAVTDDTQMALFTMEGLIRSRGTDVPRSVHAAHRRWYGTQVLSGPPKGGLSRKQPLRGQRLDRRHHREPSGDVVRSGRPSPALGHRPGSSFTRGRDPRAGRWPAPARSADAL